MQYPWAVVGAQVICVSDKPWGLSRNGVPSRADFPRFMQQYTIRKVTAKRESIYLCFEGIPRAAFWIKAFRPLETITDETTIEIKETIE